MKEIFISTSHNDIKQFLSDVRDNKIDLDKIDHNDIPKPIKELIDILK